MSEETYETFDLVIVGSGGGGLVAAVAAADAGLRPVVLEKQKFVGGSTAMSGGAIWMPNNPLMQKQGISDSYEEGQQYLQSLIGDPDASGSTAERRHAFLTEGPKMISFIQEQGVELIRCEGYPDYYDSLPGGHVRGRSIEGIPWNGKQLGEWHERVKPGMARGVGLAVKINELRSVSTFAKSFKSFWITAKVVLRTGIAKLLGKDLFTNGMSLIGQLTKVALDKDIPIWLDSGVEELVVEDGRVVGVRATRNGVPTLIRGRGGVLLAAGGFDRNAEFRLKQTEASHPNDGTWSFGNPGNTGEVLKAAIALGAKVDYMDEGVWFPTPRMELAASTLKVARQWPHTAFVNQEGKRFVNESNSYVEVVQAMHANNGSPCWLIFDDAYRKSVPWLGGIPRLRNMSQARLGALPKAWLEAGWITKADTIEELGSRIGVDPSTLRATIDRFNAHAMKGEDPDFYRGASQYNKVLGFPGYKPNPAVDTIARAPFYATQIFAGDVGTIGGVVCNEHSQVLDHQDAPIPGLYATGNMAATVVGKTYPGAGASIANTMLFGYIAAHHAVAALKGTGR